MNVTKRSLFSRIFSLILSGLFLLDTLCPPVLAQVLLPATPVAGTTFSPVQLRAINVRPNEPLVFDFVVDSGSTGMKGEALKKETEKLAKYFLAVIAIPEKDLWVNLSPYEKDRIVTDELGLTELGRTMLSQDNTLKQFSASLLHPDSETGKAFWNKVYATAKQALGTANIPVDTLNKVWIVPEKAVVYEKDNAAVLGDLKMKVMMEEDYLALDVNKLKGTSAEADASRDASVKVLRDVILPIIENEVNTGKTFAELRQAYGAMVLATWYKMALKESLLSQVYADKKKVAGVDTNDPRARQRIYEEYLAQFKQGAFNFIREDADPASGEVIPRKYFSGGFDGSQTTEIVQRQRRSFDNLPKDAAQSPQTVATIAVVPKRVASRVTFETLDYLPVGIFNEQSLPIFSFQVASLLGKTLVTEGKDRNILPNISYQVTHRDGTLTELAVFFNDGTQIRYSFYNKEVTVETEGLLTGDMLSRFKARAWMSAKLLAQEKGYFQNPPEKRVLLDFLRNNDRFSNAGYSTPMAWSKIEERVATALRVAQEEEAVGDRRAFLAGQREEWQSAQIMSAVADAWSAVFGAQARRPAFVRVIAPGDNHETFGVVWLNGELVVEQRFLDRIARQNNSYGMLTRAIIFAIAPGDWVNKKQAEFKWAMMKTRARLQLKELQNLELLRQDLLDDLNWDLLKEKDLTSEVAQRMRQVLEDAKARINRAIDTLGVYILNDEILAEGVVFFALAADPLHWGQIDALLRAMMASKTLRGVFRLQGPDFRKIRTLLTLAHRVPMLGGLASREAWKNFFSMPENLIGSIDGEKEIVNFLLDHMDDDEYANMLVAFYLAGSDHRHENAPGKEQNSVSGLLMPKVLVTGQPQPDTILKMVDNFRTRVEEVRQELLAKENRTSVEEIRLKKMDRLLERLEQKTIRTVPVFSERAAEDSVPVHGEEASVERRVTEGQIGWAMGTNMMGASSTAIRNALGGVAADKWALALLPKSILTSIMNNPVYLGRVIELPSVVRRLESGKYDQTDVILFSNWLLRARRVNSNLNADDIASMFTLEKEKIEEARELMKKDPNIKINEGEMILDSSVVQGALRRLEDNNLPDADSGQAGKMPGGIDLDARLLNMAVEHVGNRITIAADPAMLAQMRKNGVNGFAPVVINMVSVPSLTAALQP